MVLETWSAVNEVAYEKKRRKPWEDFQFQQRWWWFFLNILALNWLIFASNFIQYYTTPHYKNYFFRLSNRLYFVIERCKLPPQSILALPPGNGCYHTFLAMFKVLYHLSRHKSRCLFHSINLRKIQTARRESRGSIVIALEQHLTLAAPKAVKGKGW